MVQKTENKTALYYGSRGQIMVQAALVKPVAIKPQMSNPNPPYLSLDPKNKSRVMFKEPVVSNEYVYRPTMLMPELENNQDNRSPEIKRYIYVKEAKRRLDSVTKSRRRREKLDLNRERKEFVINIQHAPAETYSQNGAQSDDDDDEIFTLAPTSFIDCKNARETQLSEPAQARKRSYEELNHPEDESEILKNPFCQESLFSSPKIAKVAPYFHDEDSEQNQEQQQQQQSTTTDFKNTACAFKTRFLDILYCFLKVK